MDKSPGIGWFEGRAHHYPVRVFYEDTDFSGVVYYANYLRFLERGRSSFFRLAGIGHAQLFDSDAPLAFAIRKITLEYLKPARIDDALTVVTHYNHIKGARLTLAQEVYRGEELLLTAQGEAVCIDLAGRPKRMPKDLLTKLETFLLRS